MMEKDTVFNRQLILDQHGLSLIEQFGEQMPGGFFICRADESEELLYANKALFHIFGCDSLEEFKELTGFRFRGMIHPDDYERIMASLSPQMNREEEAFPEMDMQYRIIRKDGQTRWVDGHGQYVVSDFYKGLHYVFISDITDKRKQAESDKALRSAVIEALTRPYDSVWLICRTRRA